MKTRKKSGSRQKKKGNKSFRIRSNQKTSTTDVNLDILEKTIQSLNSKSVPRKRIFEKHKVGAPMILPMFGLGSERKTLRKKVKYKLAPKSQGWSFYTNPPCL